MTSKAHGLFEFYLFYSYFISVLPRLLSMLFQIISNYLVSMLQEGPSEAIWLFGYLMLFDHGVVAVGPCFTGNIPK